jgi:hypothetical protein
MGFEGLESLHFVGNYRQKPHFVETRSEGEDLLKCQVFPAKYQ